MPKIKYVSSSEEDNSMFEENSDHLHHSVSAEESQNDSNQK